MDKKKKKKILVSDCPRLWSQKNLRKPPCYSKHMTQPFHIVPLQAKAIFKEVLDAKPNLITQDFL